MNTKHGFTLVELIVVVTIIGILGIIAIFNYINIQRDVRDEQRLSDSTVIAESLEKYFAKNGEYPRVTQMTNTGGSNVKQLLGLTGLDSLIAPNSSPGTTNSLTTGTPDAFTYVYSGNTDTSASCNTGTAATDSCKDFRVQYYSEQDGTTKTIYSRNKAGDIDPIAREGVVSPQTPSLSISLVGSNVTATASTVACQTGAIARYAFQSRTNDGTWSSWTSWGTSTTNARPVAQGTKYGFRVKAQCLVGSTASPESATSGEVTYIHPINTPAAPTVTVSTSGNISTWNWNATACPAGTTARYQMRYVADWGYTSVWYGPSVGLTSTNWDTQSQGYQYTIQVQTHCYTNFATSGWSGTGQANYLRPVSAPGPISFSISRGASNIVYLYATAACHSSVGLYSRADVHTWDYPYTDTGAYGWYANSHGGAWVLNNWNFYGDTVQTGATNGGFGPYASGSRWNMATEMACRNMTTGRSSASTGRVESQIMYLP